MHSLIKEDRSLTTFDFLRIRIYEKIQLKASYEMIISNWTRFVKLRTKLMHLVRERNLENVVSFTERTYGQYLNLMESTFSHREYKLVLQFFPASVDCKYANGLQVKFQNCIIDEIIVLNYLIYLIEKGKGNGA